MIRFEYYRHGRLTALFAPDEFGIIITQRHDGRWMFVERRVHQRGEVNDPSGYRSAVTFGPLPRNWMVAER